jgi:cytochrome c-type biogenesis protein CcmH
MIGLWISAAALSAIAAVAVLRRAARAAREPDGAEDGDGQAYRRQLAEIEELGERGLLAPDELRAARAEAGRRMIDAGVAGQAPPGRPVSPRIVLAVAVAAPLLALGAYLATGSPRLPDQPYRERLAGWRAEDPSRLAPAQMAALLGEAARARPRDATPLLYLAQAQAMNGQDARVLLTLREAARREPGRADVWIMLGQAQVGAAGGRVTPEAAAAFTRAAALAPQAPEPAYFLARGRIASGDAGGGLAAWKALLTRLPQEAPQRAQLTAEIEAVERTGRLPAAAPRPASGGQGADQRAFIQAMVDRLSARLAAEPDDPAGWARLIRSYGVLDREDLKAAAIAEVRARYAARPALAQAIVAGDEAAASRLAR